MNEAQKSYGLNGRTVLEIAMEVCDTLGHGKNKVAPALLAETAAAETQLGNYQDPTPNGAGYGICQFDLIGFKDVIKRTRAKDKEKVLDNFGYYLDSVKLEDLGDDPTLSFICCRLKYRLIPDLIPTDIISRAAYWKRWYNSTAGKGTVEHYLEAAETHLYANVHNHEDEHKPEPEDLYQ